ncbi:MULTISPECIES: HD domain-containing phosphohydrolase [Thalassospira]|uniref:Response regulator n=1 Tax=Thalassospira aquimaris TaxID=3037796 RepID=A0ABT6GCW3_9PROT|nr:MULTISPECIES: HD domain-containing phosphohydrolase [Thalassospira]MDG4719841.1 response regulator [Thalassospira sp. FZY0004]
MAEAEHRILIVDDEAVIRKLLARILDRAGYQIVEAVDGLDAIEKLHQNPALRLVVSDLRMPNCGGLELVRRAINEFRRDFEFILLTGDGDKSDAIGALRLGVREFLDKPVDRADFETAVTQAQERLRERDLESERIRKLELDNVSQSKTLDDITRKLGGAEQEMVDRLSLISQYRDIETAEHCVRVGLYSQLLAEMYGLDTQTQRTIRLAGILHDIGKVGVPDEVLLKEGPLTDSEFEVMKRHTEIGFAMLNSSNNPVLEQAAIIARNHHEKWEGTGYCVGLSGEEIPVIARIVSIADVYDALRSSRRYKPPFSHLEAVDIITRGDGRTAPGMFDPTLLGLFAEHHSRFESIFDGMPDQLV